MVELQRQMHHPTALAQLGVWQCQPTANFQVRCCVAQACKFIDWLLVLDSEGQLPGGEASADGHAILLSLPLSASWAQQHQNAREPSHSCMLCNSCHKLAQYLLLA